MFAKKSARFASNFRNSNASLRVANILQSSKYSTPADADAAKYSYLKGDSSIPLNANTVGFHLSARARQLPFANSVRSAHQKTNYTNSAVKRHVEALACGLLELGLRPGDNLGFIQGTNTEHIVAMLACAKLGARLVEMSFAKNAKDFTRAMEYFRPRIVIAPTKAGKTDYVKMFKTEIFPELTRRESLGDYTLPFKSKYFPFCKQVLFSNYAASEGTKPGALTLKEVLLYGPFGYYENPLRRIAMDLSVDDGSLIVMNGGAEIGKNKAIVYSQQNLISAGQILSNAIGAKQTDRVMVGNMQDTGVFNAAIGNYTAFAANATVVYASEEWNALETLKALQQEQCTILFAKGEEVEALIDHKEFSKHKSEHLKTIVVDSSASIEAINKIKGAFSTNNVFKCFGPEEVSGILTVNDKLTPNTEVKITRDDGKIVHRDTIGVLKVRSPLAVKGTWTDLGFVPSERDEDGWLNTRKLAKLNAEGRLILP